VRRARAASRTTIVVVASGVDQEVLIIYGAV